MSNKVKVFHGTSAIPDTKFRLPLYLYEDKVEASYQASEVSKEGGYVIEGQLDLEERKVFHFDKLEKIEEILKKLDISFVNYPFFECDTIAVHSPYDGTNSTDVFYIPEVLDYLRDNGYKAVKTSFAISNYEVDGYVVIDDGVFIPSKVYVGDPDTSVEIEERFNVEIYLNKNKIKSMVEGSIKDNKLIR